MEKFDEKQLQRSHFKPILATFLCLAMILYSLVFINASILWSTGTFNSTTSQNYLCFQETANVSTSCGGLSTGKYQVTNDTKWTGNYEGTNKSVALYDGNISTYAQFYGIYSGSTNLIANYSIPSGSLPSSIWTIKNDTGYMNFTIPSQCWNYGNLSFNITETFGGLTTLNCFNGTKYINLTSNLPVNLVIYEESMDWIFPSIDSFTFNSSVNNFTRYISVPQGFQVTSGGLKMKSENGTANYTLKISIGNDNIFDSSQNMTQSFYFPDYWDYWYASRFNVADPLMMHFFPFITMNNYLSSCTYVNGNCSIPLTFWSNASGQFIIENMSFSNNGIDVVVATYPDYIYETQTNYYDTSFFFDPAYVDNGFTANICYGVGNPNILDCSPQFSPFNESDTERSFANNVTYGIINPPIDTGFNYFIINGFGDNNPISQFQWIISTTPSSVMQLNFSICNAVYKYNFLNVTFKDEINSSLVNSTFAGTFYYWIGDGSIKKNYSFQNLVANQSIYSFCSNENDTEIIVDIDLSYGNPNYNPRNYYLRGATLNATVINPTLLLISLGTQFKITVQDKTTFLSNALITNTIYDPGTGTYRTISQSITDSSGRFIEYFQLNKNYRFFIQANDGTIYSPIDKTSICTASPCEISLSVNNIFDDTFYYYNQTFANNIISSLSFDNNTQLVNYNFLDTTGNSNYFRLTVSKSLFNVSTMTICNNYYYGTAGSLTCNMSGQSGDFVVVARNSQSPEKIDKVLSIVLNAIKSQWGIMAMVFALGIILTLVFSGAVMSRGNPTVILFVFGFSVTVLKLMDIIPFSWIWILSLDGLLIFTISKIKT